MKNFTFSILLIICCYTGLTQSSGISHASLFPVLLENGEYNISPDGDSLVLTSNYHYLHGPIKSNIFVYREDHKFGLLNSTNQILQEPKYDLIYMLDRHICLKSQDSITVISDGNSVQLKADSVFHTGEGVIEFTSEGKHGIIYENRTTDFNQFGYVETWNLKVLIEAKYDEIGIWGNFYLAITGEESTLLSQKGEELFPLTDKAFELYNDSIIRLKETSGWKYISRDHKVIPHVTFNVVQFFNEGFYKITDSITQRKQVFHFPSGNRYKHEFKDIHFEKNHAYLLNNKEEIHILNLETGRVSKNSYEDAIVVNSQNSYSESSYNPIYNHYVVKREGKYGLITSSHDWLIPNQYSWIEPFGEYWLIFNESKLGIADSNGKILIKPTYDKILKKHSSFIGHINGELYLHKLDGAQMSLPSNFSEYSISRDRYTALRMNNIIGIFSKDTMVYSGPYTDVYFQDSLVKIYEGRNIHIIDFGGDGKLYGMTTYENISSAEVSPLRTNGQQIPRGITWKNFTEQPNYHSVHLNKQTGLWGTIDKRTSAFNNHGIYCSTYRNQNYSSGITEKPDSGRKLDLAGIEFVMNKEIFSLESHGYYNQTMIGVDNTFNFGSKRSTAGAVIFENYVYYTEKTPDQLTYIDHSPDLGAHRYNVDGAYEIGYFKDNYEFSFQDYINSINDYEAIQVQSVASKRAICDNDLKVKIKGGKWHIQDQFTDDDFNPSTEYDYVWLGENNRGLRIVPENQMYELFDSYNQPKPIQQADSVSLVTKGYYTYAITYKENPISNLYHLKKGYLHDFYRHENFYLTPDHLFLKNKEGISVYNHLGDVILKGAYHEVTRLHNDICIVRKNSGLGLVNIASGELVSKFYDEILEFQGEFVIVKKDGLYGVISSSGEELISPISRLQTPLIQNSFISKEGGTYKIYDLLTSEVQTLQNKPKYLGNQIHKSPKRKRIILKNIKTATPITKEKIYRTDGIFSDGWLLVTLKKGKENYISPAGEFITESNFDRAFPFENGVALTYKDQDWNLINDKGEIIISDIDNSVEFWGEYYIVYKDETRIFIDKKGRNIEELSKFKKVGNLEELSAIATLTNDKKILIDSNGKAVSDLVFDDISEFKGGYAVTKHNNKTGIIDRMGKWSEKDENYSKYLGGGFYTKNKKRSKGLYSIGGTEIIPALYDDINILNASIFIGLIDGMKTVYNSRGEIIYSDYQPLRIVN